LPPDVDPAIIAHTVAWDKDVDGLHPVNVGRLCLGQPAFVACTPRGICELLARTGIDPEGKHAVITGRSNIVGRPLAILLSRKAPGANATVTLCHTRTPDLAVHTRQADILVAAVGRPETIVGSMIKPGAVVIDVGVNRIDDPSKRRGYRLAGDVDFESAREVASYITPVPGGVGPMTIAMLLRNTVDAAAGRISHGAAAATLESSRAHD
jgi:methylenetetrahydrofolate dehydrogenase (NADP+)/methenyltetrahydrofolate cyclohydrolase